GGSSRCTGADWCARAARTRCGRPRRDAGRIARRRGVDWRAMTSRISTATTRTMSPRSGRRRMDHGRDLLAHGQTIASPETGLRYGIERYLGAGGFGQGYLARRIGLSSVVAETVCIKISTRIDGWLRDAYFGQL